MKKKIKLDDEVFSSDSITEHGKKLLSLLKYTESRIKEVCQIQSSLNKAREAYIETLKKEILAKKSGIEFE